MPDAQTLGLIGAISGVIGAITGIAGAVLGYVSYRHSSQIKALDLRLELSKDISNLRSIVVELPSLLRRARKSRDHVLSALGTLRTGHHEKRVHSEILTLRWRQVDWMGSEVRLDPGSTKNREGRVFPFTPELRALLEAQDGLHQALQAQGLLCPYVFHRNGRPIKSFVKVWREACRLAGCPGRLVHDLRRTAVRNLVRAGVSERVAMKLTGHLTRSSVFERYNLVSDGDLRDAVRRLSETLTGTITGQCAISGSR